MVLQSRFHGFEIQFEPFQDPFHFPMETQFQVHTYVQYMVGFGPCKTCYSESSLIRHSMGPENNVGLGGCWIMDCLLPYFCMVTVPHIMVRLERMLDYRGVGLGRFHYIRRFSHIHIRTHMWMDIDTGEDFGVPKICSKEIIILCALQRGAGGLRRADGVH